MNSQKTKIAILGAGSIGCYLGGLLSAQDCDVIFIGRERLKNAVAHNGLTLTHFNAPPTHLSPQKVRIETKPSALSGRTLILLCTKSQDTASAAKIIEQHAPSGAKIVSCQNGIRNVPTLKSTLASNFQISGAIVPFNVTPTGPAAYHCGTNGALHIEHTLPADVMEAYEASHQTITYGGNFEGDQWAKLLVNLNNALNALSGGTLREGLVQRDYRRAFACLIQEGLAVAKAKNIEIGEFNGRSPLMMVKLLALPNFMYRIVMDKIAKIDAKARSSMLDDLESGRLSEIDYLQGEIVRQGQASGINVSANLNILKAVNTAFKKGASPQLSGREIYTLLK